MNAEKVETGDLPSLEISGSIATVTLRRPSVLNRLQADDVSLLREFWAQINAMESIRVLVLTGTGRVFSAGYNLDDLGERSGALSTNTYVSRPIPDFAAMTVELEQLRVPTICHLNGSVYGGATDLALSCDFRLGSPDIEMFMPASRLGLHYYTEGLIRWSHRLGTNAARKLFFTSQTIKAKEMRDIGFLTDLVSREDLHGAVTHLAEQLTDQAPRAVEGMKRSLNEISRGVLDREASDRRHHESLSSQDLREGMSAWHQTRKPVFLGK